MEDAAGDDGEGRIYVCYCSLESEQQCTCAASQAGDGDRVIRVRENRQGQHGQESTR